VDDTLKHLAVPIIRYINKYSTGLPFSNDIFKSGERFIENIPSNFDVILNSL
jgi:hypothetical protein